MSSDNKPVAFANQGEFDRAARAVRTIERVYKSERPGDVTELPSGATYWKCTGAAVGGLYPGVLSWRKYDTGTSTWVWQDHDTVTGKLLALNGQELESGNRYLGQSVADISGEPLVSVVFEKPEQCLEVIHSIDSIDCSGGSVVANVTTKWIKGQFTVSDAMPAGCS